MASNVRWRHQSGVNDSSVFRSAPGSSSRRQHQQSHRHTYARRLRAAGGFRACRLNSSIGWEPRARCPQIKRRAGCDRWADGARDLLLGYPDRVLIELLKRSGFCRQHEMSANASKAAYGVLTAGSRLSPAPRQCIETGHRWLMINKRHGIAPDETVQANSLAGSKIAEMMLPCSTASLNTITEMANRSGAQLALPADD